MGQTTGFLTKGYDAAGDIPARSAVKFGAADNTVVVATAATDLVIGFSTDIDAATGERCDVYMVGNIAEGRAGGTFARGDLLVAGAAGVVVKAAPTTGNNVRIIGMAEASAVSGDIVPVVVAYGSAQG